MNLDSSNSVYLGVQTCCKICISWLAIISNPMSLDSTSTTNQFLPEIEAEWYSGKKNRA